MVRAALLEPGAPIERLRWIEIVDLSDPVLAPGIAARAEELAAAGETRFDVLSTLIHRLAQLDPSRAARLGCDLLARDLDDEVAVATAALAVAAGHGNCPKVLARMLERVPCDEELWCNASGEPARLCAADELRDYVQERLDGSPHDGVHAFPRVLALVAVGDEVPARVRLAVARMSYQVVAPPPGAPDCSAAAAARSCGLSVDVARRQACEALNPRDPRDYDLDVDDRARTIRAVRRAVH